MLARGRVGDDYTTGCLRMARGRDTSTSSARLPFARDSQPRRCRWRRSRGPRRRARHVITRLLDTFSTKSDPSPPPRAAQARSACGESSTDVVVVNGEPVCVWTRGVRIASLAIYVLRHTSSPALTPATHPPAPATPPATLSGATRPVRQILPFTLHHGSLVVQSAMPPPHRTDARPFRSTVSAGSCHHRTELRTPPDDTAPINRDPVSSPADTFFRFARSTAQVDLAKSISTLGTFPLLQILLVLVLNSAHVVIYKVN